MKPLISLILTSGLIFAQGNAKTGNHGHNGGGNGGGNPPPPAPCPNTVPISTASINWCIYESINIVNPTAVTSNSWNISFPVYPYPCYADTGCNFLASAQTNLVNVSFTQSQTITIKFRVIANNAVFDYHTSSNNVCTNPSDFNLYIQQSGTTFTANNYQRWWAESERYNFQNGTYDTGILTLSVSLDPNTCNWQDVNGECANLSSATQQGFLTAISNIGAIGITFGGGCFAGHGVYLTSGTATFEMDGFD